VHGNEHSQDTSIPATLLWGLLGDQVAMKCRTVGLEVTGCGSNRQVIFLTLQGANQPNSVAPGNLRRRVTFVSFRGMISHWCRGTWFK